MLAIGFRMNLKTYLELKEKIESKYKAQKDALELLWRIHGEKDVKDEITPKEPVEPSKDAHTKRGGRISGRWAPPPYPDDESDDYSF